MTADEHFFSIRKSLNCVKLLFYFFSHEESSTSNILLSESWQDFASISGGNG